MSFNVSFQPTPCHSKYPFKENSADATEIWEAQGTARPPHLTTARQTSPTDSVISARLQGNFGRKHTAPHSQYANSKKYPNAWHCVRAAYIYFKWGAAKGKTILS